MESKKIKKGLKIIILSALFHCFGASLVLFRVNPVIINFNLFYHLLAFFSWWSVHTSILTVLASIMIFTTRKKSNWFTQFIVFLAAIYNLITFGFCFVYLVFLNRLNFGYNKSMLTNLQLISWHFIAPILALYYYYFFAQIEELRKKLAKTFFFTLVFPILYFFFVYFLSCFFDLEIKNNLTYHLVKKYPYFIFEWVVERSWLVASFLIASFTLLFLSSLLIWTKILISKKRKNFLNRKCVRAAEGTALER